MYIPKHFEVDNKQETINFMQKYSFATLVTAYNNYPEATNLPFLVEEKGDQIILSSHFAKANPQANDIEKHISLVIFQEPHAYISPGNYEREQNVPTWNYIAVHAYGRTEIVEDTDKQLDILNSMVHFYDKSYISQWDNLPMDYKLKMIKGIVPFNVIITDLQANSKLSQNRTETEKDNIIKKLKGSTHSNEIEIAAYMSAMKSKS